MLGVLITRFFLPGLVQETDNKVSLQLDTSPAIMSLPNRFSSLVADDMAQCDWTVEERGNTVLVSNDGIPKEYPVHLRLTEEQQMSSGGQWCIAMPLF